MRRTAIALCFVLICEPAQAQADHRPAAEDLVSLSRAFGLCMTRDGKELAFVMRQTTYDSAAAASGAGPIWKSGSQIYVVPTAGGQPKQLTTGSDPWSPAWSSDGARLAFMRNADGKSRIHVIPLDGGEATLVETGDLIPATPAWSPDGRTLAFLAEVPETKEEKEAARRAGDAYEYGRQWKPSQLWTVPVEGGVPRRVTSGNEHVVNFAWSPDGGHFAVVLSPSSDPYYAFNFLRSRIITSTDGAVVESVQDTACFIDGLQWSPDGRYIAFQTNVKTLSLLNTLRVHRVGTKENWSATSSLDLTLSGFVWNHDSRSLIVLVREKTKTMLYRIPMRDGSPVALGFSGRIITSDLLLDKNGRSLVFMSGTFRTPPDPTSFDLQTQTSRIITRVNPQVDRWSGLHQEIVRWKDSAGVAIEGVFSTPDSVAGGPAPLIVIPHGGPDGVSDEGFDSWTRYFVAHGFSVLTPNYRGSLGYGYEFYAANRGRLGEVEFADIESGVDFLISVGKADSRRLFYGGWSWGGFTTAWTIGHTSRYRAAMVGAGVSDVINQYVTSDINHGIAAQWEYKGNPWKQTENFDRSNPLRFLRNATTPTLIIHGQNDTRVPFSQGLTVYRALSDVGCATKFLVYPRESHGFREAVHSVHYLKAWLEWYRQHMPQ